MSDKREVDFHNRVKMLRVERSLSRKELAKMVNVHPQTIGYIERRQFNPSVEVALRLSIALGVGLDSIFSRDPFELLDDQELTARNTG